jgi:pyruvate formate lyase activating enzyme
MKILSFIPTSFSDWDGKLVSVLFLGGCNFDCPFCQNHPLLTEEDPQQVVPWATIANHLKNRKQWIDGVVVTGGEPLLHPEITGLCREIKKLGFAVKLDTNGSFPFALMKLWDEKLVDYVAMDVKTTLDDRYDKACSRKVEIGLVRRSLKFLLEGKADYELRTTLVPGLVGKDEIRTIAKQVKGARRYALQQYVPGNARTETYRKKKPYRKPAAEEFAAILRPAVEQIVLRGKFEDE